MRFIFAAMLLGFAVAASVAAAQPSPAPSGWLSVRGYPASGDIREETTSRLVCRNLSSVTGFVISPKVIVMRSIVCGNPIGSKSIHIGNDDATDPIKMGGFRTVPSQKPDNSVVTMNVRLAKTEDGLKMLPGHVVTLSGDFSLITANDRYYLLADHAEYLHGDPFK